MSPYKRPSILLKPAALSMYDLLLPPGIKGSTGLYKCLQFAVHCCIGFKELKCMPVFIYFIFEPVLPTNFYFVPLGRGLFFQYLPQIYL